MGNKRPSTLVGSTSLVPINLYMQFYTLDECVFNSYLKFHITEFMVQDEGTSTIMWQCFEQFIEFLKRKLI